MMVIGTTGSRFPAELLHNMNHACSAKSQHNLELHASVMVNQRKNYLHLLSPYRLLHKLNACEVPYFNCHGASASSVRQW